MKNIIMYTGPMCNFCDAAKRLFERNNLSYKEIDISTKDVYVRYLNSIGNYKLPELVEMATQRNISLMNGNKKKVKKQLYDEINLYELNTIC